MHRLNYAEFLEGRILDDRGRHVNEILQYDENLLEKSHNYIQRMFPTDEQSTFAGILPALPDDIAKLRASDKAKKAIRKMYGKMLAFWKLDGERYKDWGSDMKRNWNTPGNHNCLRMTRLLRCFKILGMEDEFTDFSIRVGYILKESAHNPSIMITPTTASYWTLYMKKDSE